MIETFGVRGQAVARLSTSALLACVCTDAPECSSSACTQVPLHVLWCVARRACLVPLVQVGEDGVLTEEPLNQRLAVAGGSCFRSKRGLRDTSIAGAFGKDRAYLEGAIRILQQRDSLDFRILHAGKVSLARLLHICLPSWPVSCPGVCGCWHRRFARHTHPGHRRAIRQHACCT